MIEHRSIVSQMRWMHDYGHLGEGATVLQKTPMSFDAAQWEILAPAVGGRVVMGAPGGQLARAFLDELPWVSLVNLYGPTECTINATACLVDRDAIGEGPGMVPIGVPVDNTQCFILDADRAPGGHRGDRRTVHRRRPVGTRLPASARPDRRAVHPLAVRPDGAAVPDR